MYSCCAYDPGLFAYLSEVDETMPSPFDDRALRAVAVGVLAVYSALLILVA